MGAMMPGMTMAMTAREQPLRRPVPDAAVLGRQQQHPAPPAVNPPQPPPAG